MVHMIEFDDYELGFAKDVLSNHIFRAIQSAHEAINDRDSKCAHGQLAEADLAFDLHRKLDLAAREEDHESDAASLAVPSCATEGADAAKSPAVTTVPPGSLPLAPAQPEA
jgi:hypothetical protein